MLASIKGVEPGDVDLIAPTGVIDAGDAGIRVSGNINLAAVLVVNAGNIAAGGSSTGTPSTAVSTPSVSAVTSAANASAATTTSAAEQPQKPAQQENVSEAALSIISVEVIGYGGGSSTDEEEDEEQAGQGDSASE